jgi:hypothetical protein
LKHFFQLLLLEKYIDFSVKQYLTLLQTRAIHFIYSTTNSNGRELALKRAVWCYNSQVNEILDQGFPELPPEFRDEQKHYVEDLVRWEAAFASLRQKTKQATQSILSNKADMLLAQSITVRIILTSTIDTDGCAYDSHYEDFKLIIELSRSIVRQFYQGGAKRQPHFTFDHGILPSIHIVGKYCRDRVLRREAIALLRGMNCSESVLSLYFPSFLGDESI